jgi:hypothetical protein
MPSHQNRIGVWVFLNGCLQALPEVFLAANCHQLFQARFRNLSILGGVLDNWYSEPVIIAQVSGLSTAFTDPFNLLQLFNFEQRILAKVTFNEQSYKDSPLRVRMYAAASSSLECCKE